MSDHEGRLSQCFTTVFPGLSTGEIGTATTKSVADWDSMANINLLCVVEEEFGVEIAAEDLEELTSFAAILQYLKTHDRPR
jgi:acyl carrier protein